MMFVDPGAHFCGVSRFTASGELLSAHWATVDHACMIVKNATGLVIEKPQVYASAFQKGNQNDLIDVAVTVGRIQQAYQDHYADEAIIILPNKWKGTKKKLVTIQDIIALAKERDEFSKVDLRGVPKKEHEDVWDAVGIGYWFFKKLHKRKIFTGDEPGVIR
jgi:hypothetical protein